MAAHSSKESSESSQGPGPDFLPAPLRSSPKQHVSPYASLHPLMSTAPSALATATPIQNTTFSPSTSAVLARVASAANDINPDSISRSSPGWEAARSSVLAKITTVSDIGPIDTMPTSRGRGGRRGRGLRKGGSDGSPRAEGTIRVESLGSSQGTDERRGKSRRGGRRPGSGRKRKRGLENTEEEIKEEESSGSERFRAPGWSRSGRKIIAVKENGPKVGEGSESVGKKGRGGGRWKRQAGEKAVCKNCGRGHSPKSNVIVFCDGCNTPWHQYCHDPRINEETVRVEEVEWLCGDCIVMREEKKHVEGKVGGEAVSLVEVSDSLLFLFPMRFAMFEKLVTDCCEQRRRYLQTLPQEQLVALLLHATFLHPSLPIFSSPLRQRPPTSAPGLSSDPISHALAEDADPLVETEEQPYDDRDLLPYPKPGNGLQFPPESQSLALLLDEDIVTFSHLWRERSATEKVSAGLGLGRTTGLVSIGA
ncbi:hypothetical protein MMC20_007858 [Loxospora ochrophaea]|nr:hypothetical protein [Loxospora ochrophaea]